MHIQPIGRCDRLGTHDSALDEHAALASERHALRAERPDQIAGDRAAAQQPVDVLQRCQPPPQLGRAEAGTGDEF